MIAGIAHVALTVADLDRSVDFYTRVLGLARSFDLRREDGTIVLVYLRVAGRQFVELFPAGGQPVNAAGETGHVCFEVDDLDRMVENLRGKGVEIVVEPNVGIDGSRQAWIVDPDGRRIELMQVMPHSLHAQSLDD